MPDPETHPWEDPEMMTRYHVQVETADMLVSYDVLCEPGFAREIALDHFRKTVGDPDIPVWIGSSSSAGYAQRVPDPGCVTEWEIVVDSRVDRK